MEDNLGITDAFRIKSPTAFEYSYAPQGPNERGIFSRIDHLLANLSLIDEMQTVEYVETGLSDHKAIMATFSEAIKPGKGIWKINEKDLDNPSCDQDLRDIVNSVAICTEGAREKWEKIKKETSLLFRSYARERTEKEREEKRMALAGVEREEKKMKNNEPNSLAAAKTALSDCIRKEAEKNHF